MQPKINALKSFLRLTIYGFNSAKFDIPAIASILFDVINKRNWKLNVLKKEARYFSVEFNDIIMLDILNFTVPTSLSNFLQQFNETENKIVHTSIEQMKSDRTYPPYEAFYRELKVKKYLQI